MIPTLNISTDEDRFMGSGHLLSHPNDGNEDVVRVGCPEGVEGGVILAGLVADALVGDVLGFPDVVEEELVEVVGVLDGGEAFSDGLAADGFADDEADFAGVPDGGQERGVGVEAGG